MPPTVEALDPAMILDEWISRTQNLPEEIRFLQDEVADKDRQYAKLVKEIEERDGRIQKWIKANGSHQNNPKEDEYRALIRKNFAQAEKLANEKIALSQKLQHNMDKHVRQLDVQIKMLYDRAEPGFSDPDELPSLVRTSAANITITNPVMRPIRNTQSQQHTSASAPATPAASMIMNRQARESSAGPGSGVPKRGPRSNGGLGNLPATSSGLARHSSLGPGTPKSHQTAAGVQRAGSAGPRATSKASGGGAGRKAGTPSSTAGGRKKGTPAGAVGAGSNKSGLSRVKRAAKNSPSSAAESELSDADSGSADESDARTTGGRGTPAAVSRSGSNAAANSSNSNKEGSHEREASGVGGSGGGPVGPGPGASVGGAVRPRSGSHNINKDGGNGSGGPTAGGPGGPNSGVDAGAGAEVDDDDDEEDDEDDAMDVDDDDAGDDKKYCLCQNVSFGDMVACDNDDCPYEWFHWGCVGLKSEPNGKWFCPECAETMKKKGGRPAS
ncbi:inhibitor of growth proteins N-terminal histone-binding-domain-containing protein [Lasiosphaeria miniovina]|uniref:Chromatin modification-related protein n=1 Tax=Lasiosphaeria miniovina TaxID=1954250 RepID=A0AA40BH73_9PEZI|nr:inhibitor of growth proteins N-terminal histone-binding-domain-containing protein [Lasiosphaeria miniovina]KAK0734170.1 inhibitor of growth proteins N-terminal histone-binding-domain-containing protein [Lasiosphaeria miniovina]